MEDVNNNSYKKVLDVVDESIANGKRIDARTLVQMFPELAYAC